MPTLPAFVTSTLTALSGWPRRLAAVVCLLAAAASFVQAHARATSTVRMRLVVVAARAIQAGSIMAAADLKTARWPAAAVPGTSSTSIGPLLGRRTTTAVPPGMPIVTDSLLDAAIARALDAGQAATTVTLSSASQLAIVHAGSVIDLYAAPASGDVVGAQRPSAGNPSQAVAHAVRVISVVTNEPTQSERDGPDLIVATDRTTAARLASPDLGPLLATLVQPP